MSGEQQRQDILPALGYGRRLYLASPYSHESPAVREARFRAVSMAAAHYINRGYVVFCPIAHSHPIATYGSVNSNWEVWRDQDMSHLDTCEFLVILRLPGWDSSVGVEAEREHAAGEGIDTYYVEPTQAELDEVRRAEALSGGVAVGTFPWRNSDTDITGELRVNLHASGALTAAEVASLDAAFEKANALQRRKRASLEAHRDPFGDNLDAAFEEAKALQRRKRADYTGGTGPLDNYELAGRTGARAFGGPATLEGAQYALGGMVARLQEKITRAANLVLRDPKVADESAEDTWRDIGIIGFLGVAALKTAREEREGISDEMLQKGY